MKTLSAILLITIIGLSSSWLCAAQPSLSRTNVLQFIVDGKVLPVQTVADWQQRRLAVVDAMQTVMGPLPGNDKRCPLEIRYEQENDCGDYIRYRISYVAEPNSRVPAYLLAPKAALAGKRSPAVLALHQTHPLGQKVVVGLGKSPNDEYGVRLVKRGFVVLAPPYPLLGEYNPDLKALGYQSGAMKAIWDNVRGLDLLQSLSYVRSNGFGAIGHSLGGHNGIFTAVFDDRLTIVVSSCGFDAFRDYQRGDIRGWTSDRYMPRLLDYSPETRPFDFPEIIAALAPRSLFVSAPLGDTNFQWQSVDAVCAEARKAYQLYHATDHLHVEHPNCAHLFPLEIQEHSFDTLHRTLQ